MILILEMLTSAIQRLVPRQLTAATMVSPSLEIKSVSVRPVENGLEMHQSVNLQVSSAYEGKYLCYTIYVNNIHYHSLEQYTERLLVEIYILSLLFNQGFSSSEVHC